MFTIKKNVIDFKVDVPQDNMPDSVILKYGVDGEWKEAKMRKVCMRPAYSFKLKLTGQPKEIQYTYCAKYNGEDLYFIDNVSTVPNPYGTMNNVITF